MPVVHFNDTLGWITYVYGWYQDFLPLHIFSVLHAFPHDYVRIFLKEELSEHNQRMLNLVRAYSDRFEINQSYGKDVPDNCMSYRWLLPGGCYYPFAYGYNCDVDVIVYNVRRRASLLAWHREDAASIRLPFSNRIWRHEGKNCMWGCHFMIVEPYFKAVQPVLTRLQKEHKITSLARETGPESERVLYEIVAEAFGLPPLAEPYPRLEALSIACPGLHLGPVRWGEPLPDYVYEPLHLTRVLGILDHPIGSYVVERTPGRAGELLRKVWRQLQEIWLAKRGESLDPPRKEGW